MILGAAYLVRRAGEAPGIATGRPAPALSATTLDGAALSLASLRGRPVILNFWGPSCVPCREEFPLFIEELATHEADGLAIVGVLMSDSAGPARKFIADYHATWPTVDDPDGSIQKAYRVVARPQSYFIDRDGILRGIQVGQVTEADFNRLYRAISGPVASSAP